MVADTGDFSEQVVIPGTVGNGSQVRDVVRPAMIERFAREYEVDAGGIASSLKAARSVFAGGMVTAGEAEETLIWSSIFPTQHPAVMSRWIRQPVG